MLASSCGRIAGAGTRASLAPARTRQQERIASRVRALALPTPAADVISDEAKVQVTELQELFQSADLDGNGVIDRDELRALLGTLDRGRAAALFTLQGWVTDDDVDAALSRFDKDANGAIDFAEFTDLVMEGLLLEGAFEEYEAAFSAVDRTGNGSIGATELQELFSNLGRPVSMDKLADIMMKYDKDESGQIEFGEFLRMFRDQLLDLSDMQRWMTANPDLVTPTSDNGLLQTTSGSVSVVFSQEEVQDALVKSGERLVVLFCGMTWCRPCKGVAKPYEKMAAAYSDAVFLKLYGNANASCKKLFKLLKIRSTPAYIFFRNGEVVSTATGGNKSKLEAALRAALRPDELATVPRPLYPDPAHLPA